MDCFREIDFQVLGDKVFQAFGDGDGEKEVAQCPDIKYKIGYDHVIAYDSQQQRYYLVICVGNGQINPMEMTLPNNHIVIPYPQDLNLDFLIEQYTYIRKEEL